MPRSPRPAPDDPARPAGSPDLPGEGDGPPPAEPTPEASPSLAGLGIAGISRRRVAWIALTVVAAWIVVGFAGQAADGARASTQVEAQRALNARVAAETDALRREVELVTQERWILQQARAYRLGSRKERPFAVAPGAAALPADAPGSAARRLGADPVERSPLDAWLEVLFGPQR